MTAISSNLNSAPKPTGHDIGLIPMNEKIDYVIGSTLTVLARPSNATILVMKNVSGTFLVKPGDYSGGLPTDPTATTTSGTAGNGSWTFDEGETLTLAASDNITVKGASGTDKLIYYWV